MKKTKKTSESGIFTVRLLAALSLCGIACLFGMMSFAADPVNGTITAANPKVTYSAGPFFVINATPVIEVDAGPECNNPAQPCDDFALTVDLPSGYTAAHPGASLKISAGWHDTGSGNA